MEALLFNLKSKSVDVTCGTGAGFRGEVSDVKGGVLYLTDEEDRTVYIPVEKICSICERSDTHARPGFIA